MPVAQRQSPIAPRLDKELNGEFLNHKDDEVTFGSGSDLPAGINGGIAQLIEMKIDEHKDGDNKGKLFLYIAGTVKVPYDVNGVKVQGLRAMKTYKLYANNQVTKDQAIQKALNAIKQFLGDPGEVFKGVSKFSQIIPIMEAIKADAPHFRFRTYSFTPPAPPGGEAPDPMVVTEFRGLTEFDDSATGNGEVIDKTTGTPSDNGEAQGSEEDWDAVLASANDNDGEAQTKLQDTCKTMGMLDKDVEDAASWEDLVAYIKSGGTDGGGEGGAEAWQPAVNDEVVVKLTGMKSAQKLKIVKILKTTLDLRNEATKKDFLKIPWTAGPPGTVGGVEI